MTWCAQEDGNLAVQDPLLAVGARLKSEVEVHVIEPWKSFLRDFNLVG